MTVGLWIGWKLVWCLTYSPATSMAGWTLLTKMVTLTAPDHKKSHASLEVGFKSHLYCVPDSIASQIPTRDIPTNPITSRFYNHINKTVNTYLSSMENGISWSHILYGVNSVESTLHIRCGFKKTMSLKEYEKTLQILI